MIEKLEDYLILDTEPLLPSNLLKKREEFIQEIDAIIDDGGISEQSDPLEYLDRLEKVDHQETLKWLMDEKDISEDEEHYVDYDELEIQLSKDRERNSSGDFSIIPAYLLNDPEIVGFPDEEMQEEIYKWVEKDLPKHNFSIKDLGAGRCDFYGRLRHREGYHDERTGVDYFGIESNPNLCEVARQKYPTVNVINNKFQDVSIPTDYTVCIGTLNDDHGEDKWEYFNNTLTGCLSDTKTAVIFVLAADFEGKYGYLDYPIHELVQRLDKNLRWEIDYSLYEDIYKLTVHIGGYN